VEDEGRIAASERVFVRILLIARCPPYPLHLGDRLIVYHLARTLSARGHAIDLIAFTSDLDDITFRDSYSDFFASVHLLPEAPRSPASVLARALFPRSRFPRAESGAWSAEMWQTIRAHIEREQYDIAHVFGGISVYEYAGALIESGGRALPALITPYESYSLYLEREKNTTPSSGVRQTISRAIRLELARRYESFMFAPPPPLPSYRRVVVLSDADADALRAFNPAHPLCVIPNGVDTAYFAPNADDRAPAKTVPYLLFLGNYDYAPNADAARWLMREVMPRVWAVAPAVALQVVGNAPTDPMRADAGDDVRIAITGRVPDVRPYYAGAAAFACGLRFGAGIKNKVLEAMAMGCPVVATPLSADGIAATPEGDIVIADADPDAFAAALIRVLGDDALQARLRTNGRALVESRYSWEGVAAQYERLYTEIRAESL
jgi:glycosyltransferase involved in cell wall biosynthesis